MSEKQQELSSGEVIRQMETYLSAPPTGGTNIVVTRKELTDWHDTVVYLAALTDPDNPPLTPEQLARMRPKYPKGDRNG